MKDNLRKLNSKEWIIIILISIVPFCFFLMGVVGSVASGYITSFWVVYGFVFPILFIIANFLLIRKKMKVIKKIILWFLMTIVFVFLSYNLLIFTYDITKDSYYEEDALNYYSENLLERPVFPELSELGNYNSIECYYIDRFHIIFGTITNVLICKYDEIEYEKIKTGLEASLALESDLLLLGDYDERIESLPETYVEEYYFRLLETDFEVYRNGVYPKSLAFFVTNDTTCEIGFVTSSNDDLDYIEDLKKHILKECCWRIIR